jgi:hypothetical protein
MSKLVRARLGFTIGVLAVAVGVGYIFGLGAALIVAGAVAAVSFLVLVDVDDVKKEKPS